ncbi:MAG: thioredoxin family protein [Weeksellaceae bacterium]|jgi:thioredoxin 1|nr:thioredoxin family protein [Weeksellaceae bacterium]MDX9705600.1 thioredoxin family protein [Weeksellaceae bacterium]
MWQEIQKYTKSKTPVLIEFYTAWCAPCKLLGTILDEIEKEMGDRLIIKKIDIDEDKMTTIHFDSTYQIMGTPTMMLFKDGKLLWRHAGVLFKDDLLKKIQPFIEEEEWV